MISPKDVVWLNIPYPAIDSTLACKKHMYICKESVNSAKKFVKCQTFKPHMIQGVKPTIQNYIIEKSDLNRNPFKWLTLIDCDKIFITNNCKFDLKIRTSPRSDVCNDLYNIISYKTQNANIITLNASELIAINELVTKI